uniref:Ribosomal protein L20 n=1 Tax=Betaphycus gelatinus TaxID=1191690 RepID=A0A2H4QI34_9FLOR|nr:ribosomal protein L20 [Betaphycus gelatinus]ATX68822.1 ribosomal protein L20 [Betaphycus gelatinus]
MLNFRSKRELNQFITRKKKQYILKNESLSRINSINHIKYGSFLYFMRREKLLLRKSIIENLINTESGSLYSLRKWFDSSLYKLY